MIIQQIQCTDCLEALCKMPPDTFDLVLADPPYTNYVTRHKQDKESKLSKPILQQSREEQLKVIEESIRVLKPDRTFWIFTNWQEAWWFQARFMPRGLIRNQVIWNKGNWTAGHLEGSFGNMYEVIFFGVKGQWKGLRDKRMNDLDDWKFPGIGASNKRLHPTQKPVALYEQIIKLTTEPGDFILDPYVGSGSSAVAAAKLGRNYLGYELDPYYHKIATERLDNERAC